MKTISETQNKNLNMEVKGDFYQYPDGTDFVVQNGKMAPTQNGGGGVSSYNDLTDKPLSVNPPIVFTQDDAIGTGTFNETSRMNGTFNETTLIKVSNESYTIDELQGAKVIRAGSSEVYADAIVVDYAPMIQGFIEYDGEYMNFMGSADNVTYYLISLDADINNDGLGNLTAGTYIFQNVDSIEFGGGPVANPPYDSLISSSVFYVDFERDENEGTWSTSETFMDAIKAVSYGKLVVARFFRNSMAPVEVILPDYYGSAFILKYIDYDGFATGEISQLNLRSIQVAWSEDTLTVNVYRYSLNAQRQDYL